MFALFEEFKGKGGIKKLTLDIPDDVELGVTHLLVGGEFIPLYKCPFCNFKNIHENEITHHIRYNEDSIHAAVDVDKIDKKQYIVTEAKTKKESSYHYTRKEDLPDSLWPWIICLWCDYRDKLPQDLEYHFLDHHRLQLYEMFPRDYYRDREFCLNEASRIAKQRSTGVD